MSALRVTACLDVYGEGTEGIDPHRLKARLFCRKVVTCPPVVPHS